MKPRRVRATYPFNISVTIAGGGYPREKVKCQTEKDPKKTHTRRVPFAKGFNGFPNLKRKKLAVKPGHNRLHQTQRLELTVNSDTIHCRITRRKGLVSCTAGDAASSHTRAAWSSLGAECCSSKTGKTAPSPSPSPSRPLSQRVFFFSSGN